MSLNDLLPYIFIGGVIFLFAKAFVGKKDDKNNKGRGSSNSTKNNDNNNTQ